MKTPKAFDKHTFMEGFPILQPVTPTDDEHPAHWWDTDDGQVIRARQNQFLKSMKDYQGFQPVTKEGFDAWMKALISQFSWPRMNPKFWGEPFGQRIVLDFWAVVNKFIRYLNTLE